MPDFPATGLDGVALPRHSRIHHLEAHQATGERPGCNSAEGLLADELMPIHADSGTGEARADGVRALVDFISVQGQTRLHPQGVARSEAARDEPAGLARLEDRSPETLGVSGRDQHLAARLAGVSRSAENGSNAQEAAFSDPMESQLIEVHPVAQGLEDL